MPYFDTAGRDNVPGIGPGYVNPRYNRFMAVIHISRSDAASNFDGLLALAAKGDEVFIESNERVVARLLPAEAPRPRLLSESLRILKQRNSTVTLDGDFGRDLEAVIQSHLEPMNPPAWD
jgi:antitoxin (DNA-binding transcriptional repressor) of toxin-antitoxin stability system